MMIMMINSTPMRWYIESQLYDYYNLVTRDVSAPTQRYYLIMVQRQPGAWCVLKAAGDCSAHARVFVVFVVGSKVGNALNGNCSIRLMKNSYAILGKALARKRKLNELSALPSNACLTRRRTHKREATHAKRTKISFFLPMSALASAFQE